MRQQTATEAHARTGRERSDLFGVTVLATIGVVMLAWVAGLVWAAIAFFDWLVA
ncbi:hypothetical protein RAD15_04790 [Bradyrhizobium sp. 14AA]